MPLRADDVIDSSHLVQERNEWGSHDKVSFTAVHDIPVRCAKCSQLMASDFFSEAKCPNCGWCFTKAQARDMYVEAYQVKVIHGGWSAAVLEELAARGSSIVAPDMRAREMSASARERMARALRERAVMLKEQRRRENAERKLISSIRRRADPAMQVRRLE